MTTATTDLAAVTTERRDLARLTSDDIQIIKDTVCKGATDSELKMFLSVCMRTGLDPFRRQIHAVPIYNSDLKRKVMTPIIGIDGFRVQAQRSGEYQGRIGPEWCGKDGVWKELWTDDGPPFAARVGVRRAGFPEPVYGIARWADFCQMRPAGNGSNALVPVAQWGKMGPHMLAKCAEAQAIRVAFPEDTSGLYLKDEMAQALARMPASDAVIDVNPRALPLDGSVRVGVEYLPPGTEPEGDEAAADADVDPEDLVDAEPGDEPTEAAGEPTEAAGEPDEELTVVEQLVSEMEAVSGDVAALQGIWNERVMKADKATQRAVQPRFQDLMRDAQAEAVPA